MLDTRQLPEEIDLFVDFFLLDLLEALLVIGSANYGEAAVGEALDAGSARLVVEQGEFAEAVALRQLDDVYEPREPLVLVERHQVVQLERPKLHVRRKVKHLSKRAIG